MRRPADYVLIAALAAFLLVGGLLVKERPRLAWLLIAEGALWEAGILSDAWLYHGGPQALQTVLDWIWIPALAGIPVIGVVGFRVARRPVMLASGLIVAGLVTASVLDGLGVPESTTSYFNVAPLAALPLALGVALTRHRALLVLAALTYVATAMAVGGWRAALVTLPVLAIPLVRRRQPKPGLTITTLGGFEVVRDGDPITQWPSKKARTLLKILIARRGRPVARDELMELLWPGEAPKKLGNRLSVALSTLRQAIGADALRTDDGTVALINASVDVERFLARPDERAYTGDFLPEDRYEDWASDLRDQAREAYGQLLRTRAEKTRSHNEAVRTYLRLLEHDPYDAPAHQALIARLDRAGRHGEAINRRRGYILAMREIGATASF